MKEKWWHSLVGYQIYPKSFQDSNSDGIGDLPGILRRLDDLEELGINMIWICPVYQSPMVDHGYDISDYTKIDPMFGSKEDLERLIREAGKRGITVLMDLVINHTSDQHPWFQEALKDPEGKYGKYYIIRKGHGAVPPNNWRSLFGGSAWERIGDSDNYYLHLFTVGQPDLNWENKELREELYRMINEWLELGIGGFRIDAIAHIKKDFSYENLPPDGPDGLHAGMRWFRNVEGIGEFLRELKERTFQKYDCFTLAEVDDIPEEELDAYIGEDGYYCSVFDFCHCFHSQLDGTWKGRWKEMLADIRDRVFQRQKEMEGKGFFCNYQENHDIIRVPDRFLPKEKQNFYSLSMLPVLYFYLAGIPMIYQGQEIGMTGYPRKSIEEYADLATYNNYRGYLLEGMSEQEALDKINATSREHSRTPMQWSSGKWAGFSDVKPWFDVNPDYVSCNLEAQRAPGSLREFFRKVTALRRDGRYEKNWIYGSFCPKEQESGQIWGFVRRRDTQELAVMVNFTDQPARTGQIYRVRQILLNNYGESEAGVQREEDGRLLLQPWQALVMELEADQSFSSSSRKASSSSAGCHA